jgi:hypothetical protein
MEELPQSPISSYNPQVSAFANVISIAYAIAILIIGGLALIPGQAIGFGAAHAQADAPVSSPELDAFLIRADRDLPDLPISQQRRLLAGLRKTGGPNSHLLAAYFVPKNDPALAWVHPALLDRLYESNHSGSQANCYWTSHLAHGAATLPERLMGLDEYLELAQLHYDRLPADVEYATGDVLRLRRVRGGMDTHSVVYLGLLRGTSATHLVISKNGPADGPFAILKLSELTNWIYPSSRVTDVFRPKARR